MQEEKEEAEDKKGKMLNPGTTTTITTMTMALTTATIKIATTNTSANARTHALTHGCREEAAEAEAEETEFELHLKDIDYKKLSNSRDTPCTSILLHPELRPPPLPQHQFRLKIVPGSWHVGCLHSWAPRPPFGNQTPLAQVPNNMIVGLDCAFNVLYR